MPRLAAGTGVLCVLAPTVLCLAYDDAPALVLYSVFGGIWLVSLMIRFETFALQFGRRIRYELTQDTFTAYRGSRAVATFEFSSVTEWVAASGASTLAYWLGWGYMRSAALPAVLSTYRFKVSVPGTTKPRTVDPPALFRWQDRGGLRDVTLALIERLGTPVNYPNYPAEKYDMS